MYSFDDIMKKRYALSSKSYDRFSSNSQKYDIILSISMIFNKYVNNT